MKLMVIGSGGREHALAWKLLQSKDVKIIYVVPGNAGTEHTPNLINIKLPQLQKGFTQQGLEALADFALSKDIAFTVVGPEIPLAAGIVNIFQARGLKIFGPTREAAQLESSKKFAKNFMNRYGIPTAEYRTFTDINMAHHYINSRNIPLVIKNNDLADGKGVMIAYSSEEAYDAVNRILTRRKNKNTNRCVIIEDFLSGEEASFIVMVDGNKNVLPLETSQDHKCLLDNDVGPNTGGMGAYSPTSLITPKIHTRVMQEIIFPTLHGMEAEGIHFTGFLYVGLMIDKNNNPYVLEFNCRMGDPETQTIITRLKSDFSNVIQLGIEGHLDTVNLTWDQRVSLGVILASKGYPENPKKGKLITGIPDSTESVFVFHSGTAFQDGKLITSGGRVLCVVGLSNSIIDARSTVYNVIKKISFEGMQYRYDIGYQEIDRKNDSIFYSYIKE